MIAFPIPVAIALFSTVQEKRFLDQVYMTPQETHPIGLLNGAQSAGTSRGTLSWCGTLLALQKKGVCGSVYG